MNNDEIAAVGHLKLEELFDYMQSHHPERYISFDPELLLEDEAPYKALLMDFLEPLYPNQKLPRITSRYRDDEDTLSLTFKLNDTKYRWVLFTEQDSFDNRFFDYIEALFDQHPDEVLLRDNTDWETFVILPTRLDNKLRKQA